MSHWQPANDDLPASGVTAGTYGDGTHVGRVTVDAAGRVTAAADVAITGGSGTISDVTSTGATITVTNPTGPTTNVDLPASGVTAGTYGDATHSSQVTIDAEGRVTAASSVAITGGGGGGGLTTLFDSTLAVAAASIDTGAGGIAAGSNALMIFALLRTADAAVNGDVKVRFNNDSGANYGVSYIGSASGNAPSHDTATGQSSINFLTMCGDTAATSAYGVLIGHVLNYADTTPLKVFDFTAQMPGALTSSIYCKNGLGFWNSTAAVTRIAVSPVNAVNLKAGSRLLVYGTP